MNSDSLPIASSTSLLIYSLAGPKTGSISFESLFRDVVDESTKEFFTDLTKQRQNFILHTESNTTVGVCDAVDKYVPLVNALCKQSDAQKETFAKVPLKIQWQTVLSKKHHFTYLESTNATDRFRIEQIFVLFSAALCFRRLAASFLLQAGDGTNVECFVENSTEACKMLNRAAGLFDYLAKTVLPEWEQRLKGLLEMNEQCHEMFSVLCLAESQSIAAKRAMVRNQAKGVVIKVWFGAHSLWKRCHEMQKQWVKSEPHIALLQQYTDVNEKRCLSRAYWWMAVDLASTGAHGKVVRLLSEATDLANASTIHKPRENGGAVEDTFYEVLKSEKNRLVAARDRAKSENDLVYFEVEDSVFKFPDPAIVAKSSPFDPIGVSDVQVKFQNNSCVIQ